MGHQRYAGGHACAEASPCTCTDDPEEGGGKEEGWKNGGRCIICRTGCTIVRPSRVKWRRRDEGKKKKKEKKEMGAGDRRERGRLWLANREGEIGDEKIERERETEVASGHWSSPPRAEDLYHGASTRARAHTHLTYAKREAHESPPNKCHR